MPTSTRSLLIICLCLSLTTCIPGPSEPASAEVEMKAKPLPPAPTVPHAEKQRGLSWVGGPPVDAQDVTAVKAVNAEWIVQTPFGWQDQVNSPHLHLNTTNHHNYWGESDEGLEVTTRLAAEQGVQTLLKPHIWLRRPKDGKWRSDIAMDTEEDWRQWFEDYTVFALHYARLAERTNIPIYCIGTELRGTVRVREADWRGLIQKIRAEYSGRLTYAANWYKEFEEAPFWDDLDFIGVQAYFPLTGAPNPPIEELRAGWKTHVAQLEALSRREGKPVLFTEVGYRSSVDSAIKPWLWPRQPGASREVSLETQARCYQAMFETFWERPWFAGAYIWKWFPKHQSSGGVQHVGFTPQNKPAAEVLAQWYGK